MDDLNNKTVIVFNNFAKTKTTMEEGKEYIELEVIEENGDVKVIYIDMNGAKDLINDLSETINELSIENLELDVALTELESKLEFLQKVWKEERNRLN